MKTLLRVCCLLQAAAACRRCRSRRTRAFATGRARWAGRRRQVGLSGTPFASAGQHAKHGHSFSLLKNLGRTCPPHQTSPQCLSAAPTVAPAWPMARSPTQARGSPPVNTTRAGPGGNQGVQLPSALKKGSCRDLTPVAQLFTGGDEVIIFKAEKLLLPVLYPLCPCSSIQSLISARVLQTHMLQ